MKTLYLVKGKQDGGQSKKIEADLIRSGLQFQTLTYGQDPLPWGPGGAYTISAVPCVVVDVDGTIQAVEEHRPERAYDHDVLIGKHLEAPDHKPPDPPAGETPMERLLRLVESIDQRLSEIEGTLKVRSR